MVTRSLVQVEVLILVIVGSPIRALCGGRVALFSLFVAAETPQRISLPQVSTVDQRSCILIRLHRRIPLQNLSLRLRARSNRFCFGDLQSATDLAASVALEQAWIDCLE